MIENKSESQLRLKVVLIGDPGTGKTNIKNRFCRGSFRQYSNPTVGIQLSNRNFWGSFQSKQTLFELVIWDTRQYQQTFLATYFRNAFGIIYVYDITKKQSFQKLEYWRDLALKYMNTQQFSELLIGNKTDLFNFRQVNSEEARKWALSKRVDSFFQVSALQNKGIEQAISSLIKVIISKFDQTVHKPIIFSHKEPHYRACF